MALGQLQSRQELQRSEIYEKLKSPVSEIDQSTTLFHQSWIVNRVLPFFSRVYHQGGGTKDINTIHVQGKRKVIGDLSANWDHSTITNLLDTRKGN